MTIVRLIAALLIMLVPSFLWAETYMWTDEDGNMIVSSEKPPEHIKDFQTIGQSNASPENDTAFSERSRESDTTSKYDDIPPLILEEITKTARDRWPDNKEAQEAMVARQVRDFLYISETSDEYYPSIISRIAEDIGKKWPSDYERQAIYLRRQCQAYEAIRNYENFGLSNNIINSIKTRAAERWPSDCVRQEQYLRKEAEYYEKRGKPIT